MRGARVIPQAVMQTETRTAFAHVPATARHSLTGSVRKTIHEATRSGFVRAIWCDFVDRSGVIPETQQDHGAKYFTTLKGSQRFADSLTHSGSRLILVRVPGVSSCALTPAYYLSPLCREAHGPD